LKKILSKISASMLLFYTTLQMNTIKALAAGSDTDGQTGIQAHVSDVTDKIKNAVANVAMPIGGVLIFLSIVIVAIKIIVSHYNPNKRSEALGGLLWVALGAAILGCALVIAGWIISVTSNGGKLYGM
jgi:cytochrome bd-type quinol oxidase subunit 1